MMFFQVYLLLALFSTTFAGIEPLFTSTNLPPSGSLYSFYTTTKIKNRGSLSEATFIVYYQNRPFAKFVGERVGFNDYSTGYLNVTWAP